uniref:C2 domain-containing protein n=1 Tax=Alexandrium monilatum TaxID=311494 RepID=A0A7S4Q3B4_9DINO
MQAKAESRSDILPRVQVAKSSSLGWVDAITERLWPKINAAMQKAVIGGFELKILSKLPAALRSLTLEGFSFGDKPMRVTRVEVWEAPCQRSELARRGLEIHLRIAADANTNIQMRIGPLSAGINKLSLKGTLVIRLDPLLDDAPIVGGVVCYFLDPPTIDLTFSGVAHIADSALLASKVRSTIDSLVAGAFVLPNVQGVSLAKDEDKVDTAMLKDPKPQGVLRITALSAQSLYGHDWHLFGKATSDPYLRLKLSADEWQSPVVYKTCDPAWTSENTHDFLVYDMVQKLRIDVHDWGPSWAFDSGDVIGRARPLAVMEVLDLSREAIPLYHPATDFDHGAPDLGPSRGALFLHFQWLNITPERLQKDGCIVKVKIDEVYIPSSLGAEGASVVARIGDIEKSTPVVKHNPAKYAAPARHSPGKRPIQPPVPGHDELEIEYILSLTLDKAHASAALESKSLELTVVDSRRNVLGLLALPLRELAQAPRLVLTWDRASPMVLPGSKGSPPILLEVQLSMHGMEAVSHAEACAAMQRCRRANQRLALAEKTSALDALRGASLDTQLSSPSATGTASVIMNAFSTGRLWSDTVESLHWVNQLFAKLWPKMAVYLQRIVEDPYGMINRKLQAKVPNMFKSLRFTKFRLGSKSPIFGPIKVLQAPARRGQEGMRGIELQLGMQLGSDADILLSALHVSFGVQKLRIQGELVIRLEPLMGETPVVGGVVVCFLDQPKIEMDFVKLARIVDNSLLAGTVHGVIDHAIAGALVMPNVWGMRLAAEGQGGVDTALLRTPKPLGVLRVTAIRAEELPASTFSVLAGSTSNPYLKLRLADDEWASSVVSRTCNPVWGAGDQHEFLFFDWRQRLGIEVLEGRALHHSGAIARAEPLPIMDALRDLDSQGGLPLFAPVDRSQDAEEEDLQGPCGRLYLRCEWLVLKLASRGSDEQCVVRVKADEVWVPRHLGQEGAILRARIGRTERLTPVARYNPPKLPDAEEGAPAEPDPGEIIELEIEFILHLLVQVSKLDDGVLELELGTKQGLSIGKASIPMCDVLQMPDLSRDWGDQGEPRLEMIGPNGARSEAMINVSVRGLERASRALLANPEGYSPPE